MPEGNGSSLTELVSMTIHRHADNASTHADKTFTINSAILSLRLEISFANVCALRGIGRRVPIPD